jgi:hypothetical protein
MLYLKNNTSNQIKYLTLNEGRTYFNTAFSHYLFVLIGEVSNKTFAQVLNVIVENERYTKVEIDTTGIVQNGRYAYYVYGQNSNTNLDPTDASVVGLVEEGTAEVVSDITYYTPDTQTIPTDIIYTGY